MFVKDSKKSYFDESARCCGAKRKLNSRMSIKIPASWTRSSEPGELNQIYGNNS
jgi:hypothetical protein